MQQVDVMTILEHINTDYTLLHNRITFLIGINMYKHLYIAKDDNVRR